MSDAMPPSGGVPQPIVAAVVTDRKDLAERLSSLLRELGHEIGSPVSTSTFATSGMPACDIGFLDGDAAGSAAAVRRHLQRSAVALVVIVSAENLRAGVDALDAGADDFVTTHTPPAELAARVRAVLRRHGRLSGSRVLLTGGPVVMDVGRRRVAVSGQPVQLTSLEFKLLAFFLMHPDEPVTRDRLLQEVWGFTGGSTATVTVNVRRLREKIEADPADPMLIRTVWGVGYRFSPMP